MTTSKALILKLTALRDLLKSGCGTGAGGFQPGNTCGRGGGGNSSEGGERRKNRGKKRKRRGPDTGVGPRTRASRRRRSGRDNANRRVWLAGLRIDSRDTIGRNLYRSQIGERKDLADSIKQERKDLRSAIKDDHKNLGKEIRQERTEGRKERAKERSTMVKDHKKEAAKLERTHEKQRAKLDSAYEAAKAKPKNPERLEASYKEKRSELSETHKEEVGDLVDEHKQARSDLLAGQREERLREREEHRDRIESTLDDDQKARFNDALSHREQIYDLRTSHREERAEMKRDARERYRDDDDDKAFDFVDVKASPSTDESSIPSAEAILTNALIVTGHAEAYEAGTLSGTQSLEVLHAVRLEARSWLRSEAQAVLDGLEEKALFGAAKAKVGAFFEKAKKGIREIIAAGLLAIAGPGPVLQQEAIAEGYEQQVAIQAEYLADFRKQIVAEAKPLDGTFVARAESYGNAAWSGAQAVVRAASTQLGIFDEEMREHIGKDKPCVTCREEVAKGWVPIGTLKAIGDSECMSGCHCVFWFRKGPNGVPHMAGRGPLWRAAFGRTG